MRKPTKTLQIAIWHLIKGLFILPIFIVGCSGSQLEDTSDFPRGIEAKEAPMWAKQVAEGKLPPLSERLPENPTRRENRFRWV